MEAWLEYAVRQVMLYSLPVLISLSLASWMEMRLTGANASVHAFHALQAPSAWLLPLLGIAVHQPVVLALGRAVRPDLRGAAARFAAHLLLLALGVLLYAWALAVQPAQGVPPLHQWWAKLLMYFNLCVVIAHLLPLPGLLGGELLQCLVRRTVSHRVTLPVLALLSVTPLLVALLGRPLVFPAYQALCVQASALFR